MSIGISEEHTGLADSLRGWAASVGGVEAARAAEGDADAAFEDAWKGVVEMGLATIAVPESVGGGGGTTLDQAVALESCASELVAGPLLGPAIAACVLTRAGHTAGLGALADGSVVSLGLAGADGTVLLDAPSAQQALLRGPAGWVLAPVDSLAVTPATGLDMSRRAGSVTGDVAGGVAGEPVGVDDGTVRRTAVTLAAAEAAGVARWCLRTAVAYAGVREQFGRKIGSFQAVKHLCAEMLETAEAVTAAAWDAAAAADARGEDAAEQWGFACDVAEVTCFDGAVEVAKTCIQVLGGIGFTFENGKIVEANCRGETDRLNEILDADEGARYIGEWSMGTNNRVKHPMLDTLFDEKIGGSFHLTPGQAYDVADNGNRSRIHWDLVLIQRADYGGGEIYFDGELLRKDGFFVPDDLQGLNKGL